MNRSASPGLGQWVTVSLMVAGALFLLYKLYQYANARTYFPVGLTIAGIDVGGMTRDEASEALNNRYLAAPVIVHVGEETIEIRPEEAEFSIDREKMLSDADYQQEQQDFWAGFWGFLWGRPVEVEPVPLSATHTREALVAELRRISVLVDQPAQPPQPIPGTLSFQRGVPGTSIDIDASLADVESAFYRPSNREAFLVMEPVSPERPDINLLTRLLVNHLQEFEQQTGGVASVFVMDLETGQEVAINADVAMTGMDLLKIPVVMEVYRAADRVTLTQRQLISETLVTRPDHLSANELLNTVAGENDPYQGAESVTASMWRLGLKNTFITAPYDEELRAGQRIPETPANSAEGLRTAPSPTMQTTAEDIGTLLSMLYYCAHGQGGALLALYPNQLTQSECQEQLDYMAQNSIGSLIEEGVPAEISVAHRHGWINDTHGDAGIVYSPGGDYVIVMILYQPEWLEWTVSSPLLAEISRATYNFFNFDNPYLGDSQAN